MATVNNFKDNYTWRKMIKLRESFNSYIDNNIRRALTQIDRDPDSPTYGCADREFWHYKTRDYSSSILQQLVLPIEYIRNKVIPISAPEKQVEDLALSLIKGLTRQINKYGGVNEYYPNEHSYVAGAFSLSAIARVLLDWQNIKRNDLLNKIDWEAIQRQVDHIEKRKEHEVNNPDNLIKEITPSCQHAASTAALFICSKLKRLKINKSILKNNLRWLIDNQDEEGWFNEYGGPDFGYLSVSIDALAEIHQITNSKEVLIALKKSISFVACTIGVDDQIPFELGSRNTEYFYPFGIAYCAQFDSTASWVLKTIFMGLNLPKHFMSSVDDRYLSHCTLASVVKAIPFLDKVKKPKKPQFKKNIYFKNSGLCFYRSPNYTIGISLLKGGIFRLVRKNGLIMLDHGFRISSKSGDWTNNWWSLKNNFKITKNNIEINGYCHKMTFDVPTTLLHFGLRVASFFLRQKLKPMLKKVMILRSNNIDKNNSPSFIRKFTFLKNEIKIDDVININDLIAIKSAPRQNLRYVPSANNFHNEEWIKPINNFSLNKEKSTIKRSVTIPIE